MQYIIGVGIFLFILAIWAKWGGRWESLYQKIISLLIIFYGLFLANLTGSYTAIVLPVGIEIVVGAGSGAALGYITFLVLGTIGVVTGGIGFAIGAGLMITIGAIFGGAGAAGAGFGVKTITYALVSPWFWVPILVLGIYYWRGAKVKKTINY